jgi:hypothetical protein
MGPVLVWVRLLGETGAGLRPVLADPLGGDRYLIVSIPSHNPSVETLEFMPGMKVVCEPVLLDDEDHLLATKLADPKP